MPTFKPVICQKSRAIAEKFKDETMEVKLERWEAAHKKSLEEAIKIKDKQASEWEREVREKRMLDIARSELKLQMFDHAPSRPLLLRFQPFLRCFFVTFCAWTPTEMRRMMRRPRAQCAHHIPQNTAAFPN